MRICLTTYIYGDKYQNYIPVLIYSIKKSYPDYSIMIFINGKLRSDLKEIIDKLKEKWENLEIIEHVFDDCRKMTNIAAQSFRWVVWDDRFNYFDYLYFIDADILYMKEPIPLHEQHIRHMHFIGDKGISNIARKKNLSKSLLTGLYTNYKYGGWQSLIQYFMTKNVYRLSGIHFINTKEYYKKITPQILRKYKQYIYDGRIDKLTKFANDEVFLYKMIEEAGWDMSHFAIQRNSISMFGFNEPEKKEFCPHHGIHLGIFRREIDDIKPFALAQLESDDYKFYIQQFKDIYLEDSLFKEIYKVLPQNIKLYFERMFQYYNILPQL